MEGQVQVSGCDSQQMESYADTLAKNVFENVVLWDVIGGYLGPGELKDCRLVCKTFDKGVTGCRRWKEGDFWQLHLNETNWSDPGLASLKFLPSTVKVTLSGSRPQETEALGNLSNIFTNMNTLALQFKDKLKKEAEGEHWTVPKLKKLGAFVNATLSVILGHSSSNLTTLIVQEKVLTFLSCYTTNSTVLFNSPEALQRIKGLQTFVVSETQPLRLHSAQKLLLKRRQVFSQEQEESFVNLLAINLDSLEELTVKTRGRQDFSPFSQRQLKALLERRAPALKKIELGELDLLRISPHGLSHILFPQLSHLSLRVSKKSVAQLCEFLSKNPPLKSLTVKIRGLLTKSLVKVIAEKSGNLGSLELKFWMVEEGLQWDWLRNCENLSSFSLTNPTFMRLSHRNRVKVDIEDILISMPNGMRKIAVRSSGWFAPLTSRYELDQVFQDRKFSQLEELSILFMPFVVSYDVLGIIGSRRRFPKLRKLHFSINNNLWELSGEKEFWQGLEDVCLRSASGILSEESLMEKLGGSNNLRKLTIRNIPEEIIPTAALERFVKTCKSLETLVIDKGSAIGDDPPHRVKSVQYCPEGSLSSDGVDSDSDVEIE